MKNLNLTTRSFITETTKIVIQTIITISNNYFDAFNKMANWVERQTEINYNYSRLRKVPTEDKHRWIYYLLILVPILCLIDYACVRPFISYLGYSVGQFFVWIFDVFGIFVFFFIELAIGNLLVKSKSKPMKRVVAIFLTIAIILLPPMITLGTYLLTPEDDRTWGLFIKTGILIGLSLVVHAIFFSCIADVWDAWCWHGYNGYKHKIRKLNKQCPTYEMKSLKEELQPQYHDFDDYIIQYANQLEKLKDISATLTNKAWYLKEKLTNGSGSTEDDYNLSDFNPVLDYSPYTSPN